MKILLKHPHPAVVDGRRPATAAVEPSRDCCAERRILRICDFACGNLDQDITRKAHDWWGSSRGAIEKSGFHSLAFTADHGYRLADLPLHHRDPFDRMLVVQAQTESLVFATVDPDCRRYDVQTLS